jgi:hypothetical protein
MVTPEVVGHIDPVCFVELKTNGKPEIDVPAWPAGRP